MGGVFTYTASLVGTSGPKCWGEIGTRTFRADVTSSINTNGNYTMNITGNPVSEIDGATFVIIYHDPSATYQGTMVINDGCFTFANGLPSTNTLANFNACANSVNGSGFSVTGDQQNNISPPSHTTTVNGVTQTFPNIFWNTDVVNTNVTSGQTTVDITNTPNPSDCWSWNVTAYYFQTNGCTTCTGSSGLTTTLSSQDALCGQNNGWAFADVTGGTAPYSYSWSTTPVQTGATATGLAAGTYTCSISDLGGCNHDVVIATIISTGGGPVVTTSATGGMCNSGILVTGYPSQPIVIIADAPNAVSYLWSNGATTPSISVTACGIYSVTATDINGCTGTGTDTVPCTSINVSCGHNGDKVILCHVPPGNPGNPQTICVAASAIPAHLANHPGDCVGPCSLYYAPRYSSVMNTINEVGFYAEAYPNPFNNGFALHLIAAPDEMVTVNIYDVTGRIVETMTNVTEQTQIGTKLAAGTYAADVVQGENHQMLHLVKVD
jgi:hypothetical protein